MILFQPITEEQLPQAITFSYEGDTYGLATYYGTPCTVDEAVQLTMVSIIFFECDYALSYFNILCDGEFIGYMITSGTLLYSFCITKKYRSRKILTDWWSRVVDFIGTDMTCILPSSNIRAINFVKRRGMKIVDQKPAEILFSY